MFTKRFLLDAGERAIKTFAQGVVGVVLVSTDINQWKHGVILGGTLAGLSLLTSIASLGQKDSISPASVVPPQ